MKITVIDSNGAPVEEWALKNSFIKDVDFGNYKYETEALKNVKVIVVSDWVDYQSFRSSSGVLTNTAVGG